ncbi:hypothetical protein TNCV_2633781 [Trichonephila clavipes]|nr:hypothetical protein TNCV_2633781 [Trichonephila clavipes]
MTVLPANTIPVMLAKSVCDVCSLLKSRSFETSWFSLNDICFSNYKKKIEKSIKKLARRRERQNDREYTNRSAYGNRPQRNNVNQVFENKNCNNRHDHRFENRGGRNQFGNRGPSENFNRGDRRHGGRLNCLRVRDDQLQIEVNPPIRIAALQMSPSNFRKLLRSRVNEKIAQFCVTGKKRTEVVSPPIPPNRRHGMERARGGKGGEGTPRDLRHIGEKVG